MAVERISAAPPTAAILPLGDCHCRDTTPGQPEGESLLASLTGRPLLVDLHKAWCPNTPQGATTVPRSTARRRPGQPCALPTHLVQRNSWCHWLPPVSQELGKYPAAEGLEKNNLFWKKICITAVQYFLVKDSRNQQSMHPERRAQRARSRQPSTSQPCSCSPARPPDQSAGRAAAGPGPKQAI